MKTQGVVRSVDPGVHTTTWSGLLLRLVLVGVVVGSVTTILFYMLTAGG